MHPLYNLEVEVCLPFCDPCLGCVRSCLQNTFDVCHGGIKNQVAPEANVEIDRSIILEDGSHPGEPLFDFFLEEGEDAMGRLGYGIVSYFQLIYTFMIIFAVLLVVHLPLMYNYAGWKAYDDEKQVSMTTSWTIGNLG